MSVNTNIYGTSEQWSDVSATSGWNVETMKYKIARFGGGGNTLADGYGYGIEINKPIDKSLSWCGLGNFSTWSKLEYHKFSAEFELIAKDNRSVTNFSWNTSNGSSTGIYLTEKTSVADTRFGALQRFSPNAIMGAGSKTNYNNGITPLAQIPIKNCVLVPYFRVCRTLPTSSSTSGIGLTNVVAWDYYGTTASGNHTTHPYIVAIYFMPYYFSNSTSTTRTTTKFINGHSILDEISLQKDIPLDMDEPDGAKNSGVYAYNIFKPYSILNGIQIFGHSYNDFGVGVTNDFIYYNKTAFASGSSTTFTNNIHGAILYPHDNAQMSTEYASGSNFVRFYYLEYYDGLQEWVRKQLACFGLFFTDVKTVAESGELNDDDMLLGILDDNNIGQGFYSHGDENEQQKQWTWDTTNDSDYNPSGGGDTDPNTYSQTSGFNSVLNAPEGFNKRYVLSATDVRQLNTDFFQALNSKPDDIDYINYSMSEFLTNDPINAIVSLKWFPFTVPTYGSSTPIKLGNYQTTVSAPYYTGSGVEVYNLGSFNLFPHFGNSFLDYEPYSKTSVVIPYCGTVQLDHSIYMGTTVSVHLIVDIYTGACTAQIKSDGLVVDSVSGVCSVDLPISGIDNATLEGQIYNASLNLKSSKITEGTTVVSGGLSVGSTALGLLSGSPGKRIKSGLETVSALTSAIEGVNQSTKNLSQNKYDLSHVQIPFKSVGAQTGLSNAKFEQFCRVLLYRPIFLNGAQDVASWYDTAEAQSYAKTVGYATVKSGTLGSFTGFTVCSNADLSGISATDSEKEQILSLLKSGIYM